MHHALSIVEYQPTVDSSHSSLLVLTPTCRHSAIRAMRCDKQLDCGVSGHGNGENVYVDQQIERYAATCHRSSCSDSRGTPLMSIRRVLNFQSCCCRAEVLNAASAILRANRTIPTCQHSLAVLPAGYLHQIIFNPGKLIPPGRSMPRYSGRFKGIGRPDLFG